MSKVIEILTQVVEEILSLLSPAQQPVLVPVKAERRDTRRNAAKKNRPV